MDVPRIQIKVFIYARLRFKAVVKIHLFGTILV